MGNGLLLICAGIYIWVAATYYCDGRYGMCIAFTAYAAANAGFVLDGWK